MAERTILVVEDDAAIRRGILDALTYEGYATLDAGTGKAGLEMALKFGYDLLLLDLILPGIDGLQILQTVKQARSTVPVIILTAKGAEADRVRGLRNGADDYVTKPFSVRELLARIEAVLRRSAERPTAVATLAIPGGSVDFARRELHLDNGDRADLTEREIQLLQYLAANPGRAVSREELLQHVWRINPKGVETRTVDMHVARLRDKMRASPEHPDVIQTVRGKGYRILAQDD